MLESKMNFFRNMNVVKLLELTLILQIVFPEHIFRKRYFFLIYEKMTILICKQSLDCISLQMFSK